ncbi:hypothetical protein RHSIM_Rhsim13G0145200 [Rhododendron simsii]|uniref:Uncharacterized protein n=1 Tax=Rhododendron simsii TaxID=118357 RepID=A0A834L5S8_RHOSS|nr:hypothetical protein RHSIM_Rhsim13G0145200 [Rhododendron simsii]
METKKHRSLILGNCSLYSVDFASLDNAMELDHPLMSRDYCSLVLLLRSIVCSLIHGVGFKISIIIILFKWCCGVLVGSSLHWVMRQRPQSDTANLIASFDLRDETID